MRSSTETLIVSMRVLAKNISSEDGVANAAIAQRAEAFLRTLGKWEEKA